MHRRYKSGEDVSAPEPVRRAMNLVEEFFGLILADAEFYPNELHTEGGGYVQRASDHYHAHLMSPTGRKLAGYPFASRRSDGWVTINGGKGSHWEKVLQTAIDNFINKPQGGPGVLGDWKPDPTKLDAGR